MSHLEFQHAHSILHGSFNMRDLGSHTGVKPRTIRYYIKLGLVFPPHGKGPGATYNYSHILQVTEVEAHQKENWSPVQLAEFTKSPLHWKRKKITEDQNKERANIKNSIAITSSLRIEWDAEPSSLERRIINLLAKVGRKELKLQKEMSKKLSRKRPVNRF